MTNIDGTISCSVEKWLSLVNQLEENQRYRFYDTGLHGFLQIPSIKMRNFLLSHIIKGFNPNDKKFKVYENDKGGVHISLRNDDVHCIFGLKNEGINAHGILSMEGAEAVKKIPRYYVNKNTSNIMIDDLIDIIVKGKSADDDFVRMTVLVLLGTIIAPVSTKFVPKQYYALVQDVKRIAKINWNNFTLRICLHEIGKVLQDGRVKNWPMGNLALVQVCFI